VPTDKDDIENDSSEPDLEDIENILKDNGFPVTTAKPKAQTATLERQAFVDGLFAELKHLLDHHLRMVREHAGLQAKIMITEKNIKFTKEHLFMLLSDTPEQVPKNWEKTLENVRFIGARLGDACLTILKEKKSVTTDEMLGALNNGQFRFRTGYPLREIHAALLRHPDVRRENDLWIYDDKKEEAKSREEVEAKFQSMK
jgi:hypothetical protein